MLVEEAGVPLPVPGDFFIATRSALPETNYFYIVAIVVSATLIGSTFLFTISKNIGNRLLTKYGKYIKVTPEKVKKLEKWLTKYGGTAIVIGRLIPGLRIVTPIVAGTFNVSYKTFWAYTALAAFIWANIYFLIGRFANQIISIIR